MPAQMELVWSSNLGPSEHARRTRVRYVVVTDPEWQDECGLAEEGWVGLPIARLDK